MRYNALFLFFVKHTFCRNAIIGTEAQGSQPLLEQGHRAQENMAFLCIC